MPQVRIASGAGNRRPLHAQRAVGNLAYVLLGNRLPEARPAGSGIELRRGTEQRVIAADAAENSLVVNIQKLPTVGEFCIRVPRDFKYSRGQLFSPLVFRLHYSSNCHGLQALPRVGELHDHDLYRLLAGGVCNQMRPAE